MTKTVIVAGCSWLMGEWHASESNTISVCHPGVSEYMPQWCRLKNLSRKSASNWAILEILINYMNQYGHMLQDFHIVVFQTDPMRWRRSEVHDVDYGNIITNASSLDQLYQSLCEIWYIKLDQLAQRHNCKIHVMGALSDVDVATVQMYQHLECVSDSWIKLLYPQHNPSPIPLLISSDIFEMLYKFKRYDLVDALMIGADKNFVAFQDAMETEFFGPGYGHFHPSRQGHRVLSDYLKTVFSRAVE